MTTEFFNLFQSYAGCLGGLLGLLLGSFLNVVIHRTPLILENQWRAEALPSGADEPPSLLSLSMPRSHCPQCQHTLAWWENIPVVSYLALKGQCSACSAPIGWRYPAVELFTAALLAWCFGHWGLGGQALVWSGFACTLVALACIDWDTTLLPDQMTQPLTWTGLVVAAVGLTNTSLTDALWGAVAGYLSLWIVYWLFKLCTGKEGMGYGDFKLFAALGAWFGWTALIPLILLASLAGIGVGLVMQRQHTLRENHYIPFGPFLAMAAWVMMIGGPLDIFNWLA